MARRRNRLLRRFIVGAALLSAALALFHALLLPAIARGRVKQAFRDAGAPISSFEIERVDLNVLRLTNIRLGEDVWLSASAIDIHYGLDLLWTGHLRTIEIHDPQWIITRDERGIHIGPQFEGASAQGIDRIDLPFDHLIVTGGAALFQGFPGLERADFNFTTDRRSQGTAVAHLQIANLRAGNSTLPGPDIFLESDGNSIHATAEWQPIVNAVVKLHANITIDQQGTYGEFNADLPPVEIDDSSAVATLIPALSDYTIAGIWSGNARITFDDGSVTPLIRLTADHASLGRADWPGALESFSGQFTINSWEPLLLEGTQRFEIHQARWADMPIEQGRIEFSMREPQILSVDQASWSMGPYGRFDAEAFEVNLAQPRFETRIAAQGMSLDAWLDRLSDGRVHGRGELHGWAKLAYEPGSRQKIFIGDGVLSAAPDGWIQTADRELVQDILSRSDAAFSGDPQLAEVRDRLVAALQDYAFTRFEIRLVPQSDGVKAEIETSGRGRTGREPQEVSLNLNISGFDQLVSAAIQGRSLWESME